jgi:putative acetyltransferase
VIVRLETAADREAALEVERAAFGSAEEAAIVEAVRDEPGSLALVAVEDDEVVGHVQLSTAWIGDGEVLALGPIGVMPAVQGKGVGTALVAAALEEAARRGACAVILLGAPGYYGPRGFGPAAALGWANPFAGVREDGFTIHEDDFQAAVLDAKRAAALHGPVRWHPAFG